MREIQHSPAAKASFLKICLTVPIAGVETKCVPHSSHSKTQLQWNCHGWAPTLVTLIPPHFLHRAPYPLSLSTLPPSLTQGLLPRPHVSLLHFLTCLLRRPVSPEGPAQIPCLLRRCPCFVIQANTLPWQLPFLWLIILLGTQHLY